MHPPTARTTPRIDRNLPVLTVAMLAGAWLAASPYQAECAEISDRIESAFDLVPDGPVEPAELLVRRALLRRVQERGDGMTALAYRENEAEPDAFRLGQPADPAAGVFAQGPVGYVIKLARLPRPRPEAPITTGSIAPAGDFSHTSTLEADFFGRFAGSFSGSGEVKSDARSGANHVECAITGRPSAEGVSISGKCGASIFSKEVRADIRFDPASGAYTGTYVGSSAGPARLWGKRRGDAVVFAITWPKPVNGDTKATMTIRNSGDGTFAISVTDEVHPGGPKAEVTRLALSRI